MRNVDEHRFLRNLSDLQQLGSQSGTPISVSGHSRAIVNDGGTKVGRVLRPFEN